MQGNGKICSLLGAFVISRFFFIYFTITWLKKIVRYAEVVISRFVISRFHKKRTKCPVAFFFFVIYKYYFGSALTSGRSRPSDKGGPVILTLRKGGRRGAVLKISFSALRASVWSKNKGGPGPPGPLPWIRRCLLLRLIITNKYLI